MRVGDGERHQNVGFVAGKTKHEPLIARALIAIQTFAFVDALGDIGRLFVESHHHGAAGRVEAHFG